MMMVKWYPRQVLSQSQFLLSSLDTLGLVTMSAVNFTNPSLNFAALSPPSFGPFDLKDFLVDSWVPVSGVVPSALLSLFTCSSVSLLARHWFLEVGLFGGSGFQSFPGASQAEYSQTSALAPS